MATKRLAKELNESARSSDPDIKLHSTRDDIYVWKGFLRGPIGTPYEKFVFEIKIDVPESYPLEAPKVHFVTPIFHPNVHWVSGELCVDILKSEWSPAWSLLSVCRAILIMMNDPNPDSPLNCDAANILRCADRLAYDGLARMYCHDRALKSMPQLE